MAIKIKFDNTHNVQAPVLVLATRNGKKLGTVPAYDVVFKDALNDASELSFKVQKYTDLTKYELWDSLVDFKLLWVKDFDTWFEIYVELDESNETVKCVTAKSLGEAELSQINIYDEEINTESEMEKEDYKASVFYDENDAEHSVLHRILRNAAHYRIKHVDFGLCSILRTFSFDEKTILDAMKEISKELNCLFVVSCGSDEQGNIERSISVYDLESYCLDCGHRDEFNLTCPNCGGTNIYEGYGKNTMIYVSVDNLADDIKYSTDNGSVKNCFKLEAGDDAMTDIVARCNPNGTPYIWYSPASIKADMSKELVDALAAYDEDYDYYNKEHVTDLSGVALTTYNELIDKYFTYNSEIKKIADSIKGYPALVREWYKAQSFYDWLDKDFQAYSEAPRTTAALQSTKINYAAMNPIGMKSLTSLKKDNAKTAAVQYAQSLIDGRYTVDAAEDYTLDDENILNIAFIVTNIEDESDTYTTPRINVSFSDNVEDYIKQKVNISIADDAGDITNVTQLFNYSGTSFTDSIKLFGLDWLYYLKNACQNALDELIQEGVANDENWESQDVNLYTKIYVPMYDRLNAINAEIKVRENELAMIGSLQSAIDTRKAEIQDILNFQKHIGDELWLEFIAYRRDDVYKNSAYVSEGLTALEAYDNAIDFINTARKEIYKSATLQHSITATLKNLLVMKEFAPIVDYFEVGNWIQISVDDVVYRLRIVDYEIDFEDLDNISITFSDVKEAQDSASDIQSILDSASSMSSSYGALTKQAEKSKKNNTMLDNWATKGLALTKMKIVDNADYQDVVWDEHGMLFRRTNPITDSYDDKQIKIINHGLYCTDDNWLTSKAGIGDFTFWNPETETFEEAYGVIADTLVGNLILTEKIGIYNVGNSVVIDENGLTITSSGSDNSTALTVQRKEYDADNNEFIVPVMYLDSNGNLVLTGSIKIQSGFDDNIDTLNDLCNPDKFTETIQTIVNQESQTIYSSIDEKYQSIIDETTAQLEQYKADIGQYMTFNDDGLTLGATSSDFKTVIDNKSMRFKQGDETVAYINNNQLYIENATIKQTLMLGKFFFNPRTDGGVSLTWQGEEIVE